MKKVLIIDDKPEMGIMWTEVLRDSDEGYDTVVAYNGVEGLKIFDEMDEANEEPYAVITDLNMPRLDGIGVVKGLAERDYKGHVILYTSDPKVTPDRFDRHGITQEDFESYVVGVFDKIDFNGVEEVLRKSPERDELSNAA